MAPWPFGDRSATGEDEAPEDQAASDDAPTSPTDAASPAAGAPHLEGPPPTLDPGPTRPTRDSLPTGGLLPTMGRWLRTGDGRAVAVLVAIPLVVFSIPAMAGHPAIAGDNFLQNFPLRVLSGQMIASGHLPLWNPYSWSGTPLLGGLNAGSLYPGTLLFAFLPPLVAWVINMMVVYWAAGLGLYGLLRQFRVRTIAALLGALTYAFSGAAAGQMVHLPIIQGIGWIPLMVLAQFRLAGAVLGVGPTGSVGALGDPASSQPPQTSPRQTSPPQTSPWRWVVLLASTIGLVFLAGEPREMGEVEIVAVVVALWLALRSYRSYPRGAVTLRRRAAYLAWSLLAAGWSVAIGAIQLLPGWDFISASQRASESYHFFGAGSLAPSWSALLVAPDLFGGDGIFHQPAYFNSYNLPEVTGYVGLLPLVAFFALLARAVGRRRHRRAGDWTLWLFLAVFGLLLAFGARTDLGPAWGHIPFFDRLRLQSRNIAIADLAASMLLGFWVDAMLEGRLFRVRRAGPAAPEGPAAPRHRWAAPRQWWRVPAAVRAALPLVPLVAAGAVCAVAIAVPARFEQEFGVTAQGALLGALLRPWLVAQLVIVAGAAAVVLTRRRLGPRRWQRLLVAVVVADIGLFSLSTSTGLSSGHAEIQPSRAQSVAVLGSHGRFAIYDTSSINLDQLSTIAEPDLNTLTRLPSVQGYGSLVSGRYNDVTGSHDIDTLDPCALQRSVFVPLRLSTLLVQTRFLSSEVPAGGSPGPPAGSCPDAPAPGTTRQRDLYLGQSLPVRSVTLAGDFARHGPSSVRPRLGVIDASGAVTFPAARPSRLVGGGWSVSFARLQRLAGIEVLGPARAVSDASTVTTRSGRTWSFEGRLQEAVGQAGWHLSALWSPFARFSHAIGPPVWVAGSAPGSSVRQLTINPDGSAVDRVVAPRPVTVVRSEAYQPGWRVVAVPSGGGEARTLAVGLRGLVQSVRVPAGRWTITFLYRPPALNAGIAGSVVAVLGLVVCAVVGTRRRRRRA